MCMSLEVEESELWPEALKQNVVEELLLECNNLCASELLQYQNHLCRHLCPTAAVLGSARNRGEQE
jgi:hypothetical protein